MRLNSKIVLASTSSDKLREFRELFAGYPEVEIVSAAGIISNPEKLALVETHQTYLENAAAKARAANQACHYCTLADDTGLEVAALEGRPGIHSHRFAKPAPGAPPFSRDEQYRANVKFLLEELAKKPEASRDARFITVIALATEGLLIQVEGILEGTITNEPRGTNGFGYDSVFVPKGSDQTLAEMSEQDKNALSHRARAVHALMAKVRGLGIVFARP